MATVEVRETDPYAWQGFSPSVGEKVVDVRESMTMNKTRYGMANGLCSKFTHLAIYKEKRLFRVELILCLSMDLYRRVSLSERTGYEQKFATFEVYPKPAFFYSCGVCSWLRCLPGAFDSYISLLFLFVYSNP
ncbi:unnamed protein product [Penicillium roqueforti FM164]|uniref:Genomic scaffold, ProqFM164S01 n=1 Tax=Penicillium roqueforti (strain FM164) TaxID=1365484 RepID=W6PSF6_PENRF|nr:unnamed protein product [Penicillium roqueforti FM164]